MLGGDVLTKIYEFSNFALLWGIAAESTTEKNQQFLHVYVPELVPMRNGDVVNKGSETTCKLFNVNDQAWEEQKVHMSSTILAEFLGFSPDMEIPDVYKGQQVLVFQYKKGDRWFWIPLQRDDYIKTFAHTCLRVPDIAIIHKTGKNIPEEEERPIALTDDNSYFLDIDTKYYKRIVLSTAGTDGEGYRYRITMDAKNHFIELMDGEVDPNDPTKIKEGTSNVIRIESEPVMSKGLLGGKITLQNKAGATLQLEGEDIKIVAPRDITIEAGRNFIRHSGSAMNDTAEDNYELTVHGHLVESVDKDVDKHVKGKYNYVFDQTRSEEMHQDWVWDVKTIVKGHALSRETTVDTLDKLIATTNTIEAKVITHTCTTETISGSVFTMACGKVISASKIKGCCD